VATWLFTGATGLGKAFFFERKGDEGNKKTHLGMAEKRREC